MPWCSQKFGKRVEQSVQIGDVKGIGFMQCSSLLRNSRLKDIITTISGIRNENYPEMQKEYIIVNAPWWFRSKPLLSLCADYHTNRYMGVVKVYVGQKNAEICYNLGNKLQTILAKQD